MTKAQKKKLREKKNKVIKNIQEVIETGNEVSAEESTELATKWMEVADIDGNGTIDGGEFNEMITKLDEKFDESKASEIFGSCDAEGNG